MRRPRFHADPSRFGGPHDEPLRNRFPSLGFRTGRFVACRETGRGRSSHLIEEIESMGRSEQRELVNRLAVLLLYLLKWRFQPALHGNSWPLSIKERRIRLASHLENNPSLTSKLDTAVARACRPALIEAERETGLPESAFDPVCPHPFSRIVDEGFWPDGDRRSFQQRLKHPADGSLRTPRTTRSSKPVSVSAPLALKTPCLVGSAARSRFQPACRSRLLLTAAHTSRSLRTPGSGWRG